MCDCCPTLPHVVPATFEEEWGPKPEPPRAVPGPATAELIAYFRKSGPSAGRMGYSLMLSDQWIGAFLAEWPEGSDG